MYLIKIIIISIWFHIIYSNFLEVLICYTIIFVKNRVRFGTAVHTCNLSHWRGWDKKVTSLSLGKLAKFCLKKKTWGCCRYSLVVEFLSTTHETLSSIFSIKVKIRNNSGTARETQPLSPWKLNPQTVNLQAMKESHKSSPVNGFYWFPNWKLENKEQLEIRSNEEQLATS